MIGYESIDIIEYNDRLKPPALRGVDEVLYVITSFGEAHRRGGIILAHGLHHEARFTGHGGADYESGRAILDVLDKFLLRIPGQELRGIAIRMVDFQFFEFLVDERIVDFGGFLYPGMSILLPSHPFPEAPDQAQQAFP